MPPDSRSMTRSSDPSDLTRGGVSTIQGPLSRRIGSSLQQQGPMNAGTPLHSLTHPQAFTDPIMPTVPEQIGIDRREWASYSPALRQAVLKAKLPDLSPTGLTEVTVKFDFCGQPFLVPQNPGGPMPPPPSGQNPGGPGGPPPPSGQNPGGPGGPPPSGQNPGAPSPPPPIGQPVGVMPPPQPVAQPVGVQPQQPMMQMPMMPMMMPMQMQPPMVAVTHPAGQAAPQSGPQFPGMFGWLVLGSALTATAFMLWEVTRMKSEMHGRRR